MKVAFCLHGLVGSASSKFGNNKKINIKIPFSYYKKNLININHNVDIFLHSQSYEDKEKLVKLYQPKKYKIEKPRNFSKSIKHPHLRNLFLLRIKTYLEKLIGINKSEKKIEYLLKKAYASYSRWYSFREVVKLKESYEQKKNLSTI